jgi:hypothetical protein
VEHNRLPIALALLEPPSGTNEVELTEALSKLVKEKPQDVANAIVKHLERSQKDLGFGHVNQDRSQLVARLKIAKETLLANPPESAIVLKALKHAKDVKDPTSIFGEKDIEELIEKMTPADRL